MANPRILDLTQLTVSGEAPNDDGYIHFISDVALEAGMASIALCLSVSFTCSPEQTDFIERALGMYPGEIASTDCLFPNATSVSRELKDSYMKSEWALLPATGESMDALLRYLATNCRKLIRERKRLPTNEDTVYTYTLLYWPDLIDIYGHPGGERCEPGVQIVASKIHPICGLAMCTSFIARNGKSRQLLLSKEDDESPLRQLLPSVRELVKEYLGCILPPIPLFFFVQNPDIRQEGKLLLAAKERDRLADDIVYRRKQVKEELAYIERLEANLASINEVSKEVLMARMDKVLAAVE
ncbi:hypothetical protein D9611_000945 [Ephemerocybe angulata]|uniref:Uncharacterized protein n=1 Tax=Ephemerocybe angulata TaxID=980116 RepID=A0A8H5F790_9AGAR|nr:hypothetical protein D9611_000945 [Tulosesus angulatus]